MEYLEYTGSDPPQEPWESLIDERDDVGDVFILSEKFWVGAHHPNLRIGFALLQVMDGDC